MHVPRDAGMHVLRDAMRDRDARDGMRDALRDGLGDVGRDAMRDVGRDPRDAGRDVRDARDFRDAGRDAGRERDRDARGMHDSRDARGIGMQDERTCTIRILGLPRDMPLDHLHREALILKSPIYSEFRL
jgi:hypothetical protein